MSKTDLNMNRLDAVGSMKEAEVLKSSSFWNPFKSARLRLTVILMLAVMSNSFARNSLSQGIVCMVNETAIYGKPNITNTSDDSRCSLAEEDQAAYDGPLVWDSNDQGLLFSAMFWGGIIAGIPAGYLADRYDPKIVVAVCMALNLIGALLTPITALNGGLIPMFVLRFIMGLGGQASIFPSIAAMAARWIPPSERASVIAIYTAGSQIATIVGAPLNAFLCGQKQFIGGWPSIFYMTSCFTVPTFIIWLLLSARSPDGYRFISEKEKKYIQYSLQKQSLGKKKVTFKEVPWRKMLTSVPLMVGIVNSFTQNIMDTSFSAYVPTYFKQSLKFDLSSNGLLSALPFISQLVVKVVAAALADQIIARTTWSEIVIRKVFNSLGSFVVSAFLIASAYMDCTNAALAVVFVTFANGFFSCQIPGYQTTLVSIAPLYSGMVQALSRVAGQTGCMIAPYIVGAITTDGTTEEWRIVFIIIAVAMAFTGALFLFFGSAEIQEWAKIDPPTTQPVTTIVALEDANSKCNLLEMDEMDDKSFVGRF